MIIIESLAAILFSPYEYYCLEAAVYALHSLTSFTGCATGGPFLPIL